MEILNKMIRERGTVIPPDIIKVDSFLNHQVDPNLMREIGQAFHGRFANLQPTKILTVESSGIAPALATAMQFNIPLVYAKKLREGSTNKTLSSQRYTSEVMSFTRNERVNISVDTRYITCGDRVLIVDDFLATGEATNGLIRIIGDAHATVVGIGAVIEKSFQPGGKWLRTKGYNVYSLVRIESISNNGVIIHE